VAGGRLYPELPYHIGFFGRVHPRGIKISIPEVRVIHYQDEARQFLLNIVPVVQNSMIAVDCYFDRLIDNHSSAILTVVLTAIRSQIDLISFSLGVGTIVVLDWMKDYNGVVSNIALSQSDLKAMCTAFKDDATYLTLKNLATSDQAMSLALNDLILAQTMPAHAEINCARAVEGIRHVVAGQGIPPKTAWPTMRHALNLDEAYLELITRNSIPRRHGQLAPIEEILIQEILRRSWIIMDRFFHYKLRGDRPLSTSEFPLLVG
jgi:hypothetical protein